MLRSLACLPLGPLQTQGLVLFHLVLFSRNALLGKSQLFYFYREHNVTSPKRLVKHSKEFFRRLDYMVEHSWGMCFFFSLYNKVYLFEVITINKNMLLTVISKSQN